MSILNFPERGPWGKASWRGNCSGHIYRALFEQYRPQFFIDPMMGSGTSIEVANEMGIEAKGLDLHQGFNILRDSILQAAGREGDLIFSHPPYHDMIVYSGNVWGKPHSDDLSRCESEEDFLCKMEIALLNQREATKAGGHYGMLIGDLRKNGKYSPYQADLIARMPKSELASVVIKAQHNCYTTDNKAYGKMKHMRIMHEYIVLWSKPRTVALCLGALAEMAKQQATGLSTAWKAIVHHALTTLGGVANLSSIYQFIAKHAESKLANNKNWQSKVRQILQKYFVPKDRGIWALA